MGSNNLAKAWVHTLQLFHRYSELQRREFPSIPGYKLHPSTEQAMGSIPVLGTKEGKLEKVDII